MADLAFRCIFRTKDMFWLEQSDRALAAGESERNVTNAEKDPDAYPGNGYWDGTKIAAGHPNPLTPVQTAAELMVRQIRAWSEGLNAQAFGQPQKTVSDGHDWLFHAGLHGPYLALTTLTRTDAWKVKYCEEVASGASDINSVASFYAAAKKDDLAAPTSAKSWVSTGAGTPTRLELAMSVDVTGTVPDTVDLASGAWVYDLT